MEKTKYAVKGQQRPDHQHGKYAHREIPLNEWMYRCNCYSDRDSDFKSSSATVRIKNIDTANILFKNSVPVTALHLLILL